MRRLGGVAAWLALALAPGCDGSTTDTMPDANITCWTSALTSQGCFPTAITRDVCGAIPCSVYEMLQIPRASGSCEALGLVSLSPAALLAFDEQDDAASALLVCSLPQLVAPTTSTSCASEGVIVSPDVTSSDCTSAKETGWCFAQDTTGCIQTIELTSSAAPAGAILELACCESF